MKNLIIDKKNLFVFVMLFSFSFCLYAETNLAKYHLQQAYDCYCNGKKEIAKTLLSKSFEYDNTLPEYYYLLNLLTDEKEQNLAFKISNCYQIVNNIKNNYFISELVLLRYVACNIYDAKEIDKIYQKILKYKETDDYLQYVDFLLRTSQFDNALTLIHQLQMSINSITLKSYEMIAKINLGNYNFSDFTKDILTLRSNKFNPSAILLYQIMYTVESPVEFVEQFEQMLLNKKIDYSYILPILQAFLSNKVLQTKVLDPTEFFDVSELDESELSELSSDTSNDTVIKQLLTQWADFGGLENDFTDNIMNIDEYNRIIYENSELSEKYNKYSGMRVTDVDKNNIWEYRVVYQDGIKKSEEFDKNQDCITECLYEYDISNSNLIRVVLQNEKQSRDFTINSGDQSVISCFDILKDGSRTDYKITFMKSSYILSNQGNSFASQLTPKIYTKFIESIEYLPKEKNAEMTHKKEVFVDGVNTCTFIDEDNNGAFDKKITFSKGKIIDVARDLDEDGYFEVTDVYKDNKYVETKCKENEFAANYYYSEKVAGQNVEKKWDINDDGKYEIQIVDKQKKTEKQKNSKWQIVTSRKIEDVLLPQDIVVTDVNHNNGFYIHQGKKFLFYNGKITTHNYSIEVKAIDDKLYLFDLAN